MKKHNWHLLTVTLLLLVPRTANADEVDWAWAELLGGPGGAIAADTTVDDQGNSYITGSFAGSIEMGPVSLQAEGGDDIFVAKLDRAGNVVWATRAGGSGDDSGEGIRVDESGNSYVTGAFEQSASFGNETITAAGSSDVFLAKFDPSGNPVWARAGGSGGADSGLAITLDNAGEPIITGYFSAPATFDGVFLDHAGGSDIFVVSYTSSGDIRWGARAGSDRFGSRSNAGRAIGVDEAGDIYIAGHFNGSAWFDDIRVPSDGVQDMFVAKLSGADQAWEWAVAGGGNGGFAHADGLSVTPDGHVVVAGIFEDTASFGNFSLTSDAAGSAAGSDDYFVAHYDSAGEIQWVRRLGGTGVFRELGLDVDGEGGIYFAGTFLDTVTVGDETVTNDGFMDDVYLAHLNPAGNVEWVTGASSSGFLVTAGLAVQPGGNIWLGGWFSGAATFGDNEISQSGGVDSFVAHILREEMDDDLEVEFAIRPGSCTNPFSRRGNGVLPTAILGEQGLDVAEIDLDTVSVWRADGVGGIVAPAQSPSPQIDDIAGLPSADNPDCESDGPDGHPDLKLKFRVRDLVQTLELDDLSRNDTVELVVSGALLDGTPFGGSDSIVLRR